MAKQQKCKKSKPQKRRPRRRTVNRSISTIGTRTFHSAREVSSKIPGTALDDNMVDLVFTVVGRTYNHGADNNGLTTYAKVTGLSTMFFITPSLLFGQCPYAVTASGPTDNPNVSTVTSNYSESKLLQFKITAKNAGSSSIHGVWGLGYWPFRTSKSRETMDRCYTLAEARNAPFYVEAPASKPLSLHYKITTAVPFAYEVGEHTRAIGVASMVYFEPNRSGMPLFTNADFDPVINITGSIMLTSRRVEAMDSIMTNVICPAMPGVIDPKRSAEYGLDSKGLVVTHKAGEDPKFSGTNWPNPVFVTLESMAIE